MAETGDSTDFGCASKPDLLGSIASRQPGTSVVMTARPRAEASQYFWKTLL